MSEDTQKPYTGEHRTDARLAALLGMSGAALAGGLLAGLVDRYGEDDNRVDAHIYALRQNYDRSLP